MFTSVLIAAFVVVCTLGTMALAVRAIRAERRTSAWIAQQVDEDVRAGVFSDLGVVRMDVPGKYPAIRTRNSKVRV